MAPRRESLDAVGGKTDRADARYPPEEPQEGASPAEAYGFVGFVLTGASSQSQRCYRPAPSNHPPPRPTPPPGPHESPNPSRARRVPGVLFFVYLFWAYVPDDTLRALGIEYYPDKYWALAIPTWIFALGFFVAWAYEGVNMMSVRATDDEDLIAETGGTIPTRLKTPDPKVRVRDRRDDGRDCPTPFFPSGHLRRFRPVLIPPSADRRLTRPPRARRGPCPPYGTFR